MIRIEGLTVAFGRTVAVNDIDLEIAVGVNGLFGPNGSGKTTLLRAIAGLLRPTRGTVTVNGAPVSLRDESWRRRVGYAGHSAGLYAHLTLAENMALFAQLFGAPAARTMEMLAAVGLDARAETRAGDLSAGLMRRAAVARALLHDPDVLLLDEPYANLDDEAAESVSAAVQNWRRGDSIALIATHGAKKVKAYADAGIILRDGRVVVAGRYRKPAEVETS